MKKPVAYLFLLAIVALCSCHKEDEPLRVRYQNLSGLHLRQIQVDNHQGEIFQVDDLAPGDCSEYFYLEKLNTHGMMPSQILSGQTDRGRFIAIDLSDCLTGVEFKNYTDGTLTILIVPSCYGASMTLGDATHLSLLMKHEWLKRLKAQGVKFLPF